MSKERLGTIEACKRFQGRNFRTMQMIRTMQMSKERLGTIETQLVHTENKKLSTPPRKEKILI